MRDKQKLSSSQRAFTLIELLIVVVIIGILSALLMANFIGIRQRARDAQRKSDIRQIQSALELYRADNASYPCFEPCATWDIASNLTALSSGTTIYMRDIPKDPLTGTSCPGYLLSTNGTSYTLFANLENTNDLDVLRVKPSPAPAPNGSSADGYKTFTVNSGTCSTAPNNKYNFWINNP